MKNIIKENGLFALILFMFVFLAACGEDEVTPVEGDDTDTTSTDSSVAEVNYVLSLRTLDGNGQSADYYLTVNDIMTGEISAENQGIELTDWNYNAKYGDSFFSFSYDPSYECVGYKIEDGELVEYGKLFFERMDVMEQVDSEHFLAIGAPWGGGSYDCELQLVNIEDVAFTKRVDHPIYESYHYVDSLDGDIQLNAWPTSIYQDGDNVFVSFYPLHGTSWSTPNTDTAYVSVFSYPELEYVKTFKDSRTGPIGYYGAQPAIIADEAGNHYTLSSGSKASGFSQATKSSAILKINAGATEFDEEYFFDVQASGYKVLSGTYVADGLAVAKVISIENDEAAASVNTWATFSEVTPILNIAVLDLNAQTVTVVEDVPLHGGQYKTPFLVEDGKVYTSVNNGTEAHVYEVDAATATATKGAKLIGNQFQALFSAN